MISHDQNRQDKLAAELAERLRLADLISSEQLNEAQETAEATAVSLPAALFRLGFLDEAPLVQHLGELSHCSTVTLSGRNLPCDVVERIAASVAREYSIIPLEYDPESRSAKVAATDPDDDQMRQAIAELFPGWTVEYYLALEPTLSSALARSYREPVYEPAPPLDSIRTEACLVCLENEIEQGGTSNPKSADSPNSIDERVKNSCRMLVLSGSPLGEGTLGRLLSHQGYLVNWTDSCDAFVRSYLEAPPDIIITLGGPGLDPLLPTVHRLQENGVSFETQPAYLISSDLATGEAGRLLDAGYEDIIPVENILDMLLIKLARVRERLTTERNSRLELMHDLGTRGTLTDMSVIDLIQTMGNTGKTVRMSITAVGRQLTVYLDHGRVSFAECDDLTGAEAIYAALAWNSGIWNVDPIARDELPEPNNFHTNEAILLEGCRLLDEGDSDSSSAAKTNSADPGSLTSKLDIMFDQF